MNKELVTSYPKMVAIGMADKYEENLMYVGGLPYVSEDTLKELSNMFGEVSPILRASVFNDFTKELTRRGVDYDVDQFKQEA